MSRCFVRTDGHILPHPTAFCEARYFWSRCIMSCWCVFSCVEAVVIRLFSSHLRDDFSRRAGRPIAPAAMHQCAIGQIARILGNLWAAAKLGAPFWGLVAHEEDAATRPVPSG